MHIGRVDQLGIRAVAPAGSWIEHGACRGTKDATLIFYGVDDQPHDTAKAKAICAACPVRRECLDYAINEGDHFGVWGGATDNQRDRIAQLRYSQPGAYGVALTCAGCGHDTVVVSGDWPYCSLPCGSRAAKGRRLK